MKVITFFAALFTLVVPMLSSMCTSENTEQISVASSSTIDVQFIDSAPDLFVLENNSACDLGEAFFFVDFSSSAGNLYFDTDPTDGSWMAAQFAAAQGDLELVDGPILDGDQSLIVHMAQLGAGEQAIFTIDVDGSNDYQVSAAQINGGVVGLVMVDNEMHYRTAFENSTGTSLQITCDQ